MATGSAFRPPGDKPIRYCKLPQPLRRLYGSKDLRVLLLLRLGIEKTDEELAAEIEESATLFAQLSPEEWRIILKADKRGELLEVAKL